MVRERTGLSQGLFRQEVIEAKRGEWLGSIIVATPLSRWGLTARFASLFVAHGLLRWVLFSLLRRASEEQIVYGARQQGERLDRYANAMVETTSRSI